MFEGFSNRTIDFMWSLRFNNQKPWFEEHREEYLRDFLHPMKALADQVFQQLADTCEKHCFVHKVSRIYKDARRLRGSGPYRDHLWFTIAKPTDELTSAPVLWFELTPEEWSYGLGYYQARPATMAKLRARIDKAPKAFEQLIALLEQQQEFVLDGPEYARRKEAPTEKTQAWYNKKSFSLIHSQPNGTELFSPDLANRLVEGYTFLMPLYDYFATLDFDASPE